MAQAPNILLITTDQQRWDTLGCYGNKKVKTPNIDALAAQGTRFERPYTQNTICTPARACLQTGRYIHQHGVTFQANPIDRTPGLPHHELTFMEHLHDVAGYYTAAFGKIHMWPPKGFRFTMLTEGKGSRWTESSGLALGPGPLGPIYAAWLEERHPGGYEKIYAQRREPQYKEMTAITNVLPLEDYIDTWITNNTAGFMRESRDRPFFAWCGICGPHGPLDPPEPYASMYDPAEVDMPVTYLADDSDKPKHLQNGGGRFAKEPDDRIIRNAIAKYWGLCTMIDDMVGQLVQTLADAGTLENTLIIYASDHGDHMGDWSRGGKGTFWEPSARVPLIVVPPAGYERIPMVADAVETFQIAPTILDYAGMPVPEAMAATSLRPVIEGKSQLPGLAFSDYVGNPRSIRGTAVITNRYKYAYWGREFGSEFYDLQEDPHEMRNLAQDPAAQARIREHHGLLTERLLATTTPPLDMIGPEWK